MCVCVYMPTVKHRTGCLIHLSITLHPSEDVGRNDVTEAPGREPSAAAGPRALRGRRAEGPPRPPGRGPSAAAGSGLDAPATVARATVAGATGSEPPPLLPSSRHFLFQDSPPSPSKLMF